MHLTSWNCLLQDLSWDRPESGLWSQCLQLPPPAVMLCRGREQNPKPRNPCSYLEVIAPDVGCNCSCAGCISGAHAGLQQSVVGNQAGSKAAILQGGAPAQKAWCMSSTLAVQSLISLDSSTDKLPVSKTSWEQEPWCRADSG